MTERTTLETDQEIKRTAKIGVISGMEQAWQDMCYHACKLERQRDELRALLAMAACPNCDGSGSFARQLAAGDCEQQQCQWCFERSAALKGAA